MQKKIYFFIVFSYNLLAGTLSSVLKNFNFLLKFCLLQALFQSAQHLYEKREGSGSRSIPLTNGSGSGRPKNMRIPTLLHSSLKWNVVNVQCWCPHLHGSTLFCMFRVCYWCPKRWRSLVGRLCMYYSVQWYNAVRTILSLQSGFIQRFPRHFIFSAG